MKADVSERTPARYRRTILLASLGGALEYYDFILYGVFARPIAAAFFPDDAPLTGLMKTFLVFAAGYFARPLGGAILGRLGDRHGRRGVFMSSIAAMSAATFLIGVLPSHAQWGAAATVLMVLLRLVQGFSLGGELPGAACYAVETAPKRPGLATGVVFALVNSGVLLATVLNLTLNNTLEPAQVDAWGWRVGFVIGGLLGLAAFGLRSRLEESRAFEAVRPAAATTRPLAETLAKHWPQVLIGIALMAATAAYNGLLFAHMPAFFTTALHYPQPQVAAAQTLCLAIGSVVMVATAWLGDLIPRRWIVGAGAAVLALGAWPFYAAMAAHSLDLNVAFAIAGVVGALANGTFCALVADLFPTRLRYTGLGLVLNITFSLFLGLAPLIATALAARSGDLAAPGWFLAGAAALTLIATLLSKSSEGRIAQGQG